MTVEIRVIIGDVRPVDIIIWIGGYPNYMQILIQIHSGCAAARSENQGEYEKQYQQSWMKVVVTHSLPMGIIPHMQREKT